METIDPVWFFGGIALLCGILIGALAQRHLGPASGDVDKLKAELDSSRAELDEYQASVNRHFNKTSDLVNELTQDYVRVYQHLAEGAESLANNPEFARALEQSQGRVLISVEKDEDRAATAANVVDPVVTETPQETGDTGHVQAAGDTGEADHETRQHREPTTGDEAEAPGESTEGVTASATPTTVPADPETVAGSRPPRKD